MGREYFSYPMSERVCFFILDLGSIGVHLRLSAAQSVLGYDPQEGRRTS
jgi:hypothetical protein